jgi:hypothetical protein
MNSHKKPRKIPAALVNDYRAVIYSDTKSQNINQNARTDVSDIATAYGCRFSAWLVGIIAV